MATSTLSNSGLTINGSSDSITWVDASGNALTTGSKVPRFPNYSGSSTALTLPWTATANGWLRIQCINTGSSNNRVTIDNFAVAGSDVTRKADYSDYYFYSVVPVAAGQVVNKVGSATVFFTPIRRILTKRLDSVPDNICPSLLEY